MSVIKDEVERDALEEEDCGESGTVVITRSMRNRCSTSLSFVCPGAYDEHFSSRRKDSAVSGCSVLMGLF